MNELPPDPGQFQSSSEWARACYEYLLALTRIEAENDPLPVLLVHRVGSEILRATTPGVLLYDPTTSEPLVSDGGDWRPVTALASYTASQLADIAHEVNTRNKFAGRPVYDSTNNTLAVANGPAPSDTWSRLSVEMTITPA